MSDAYLTSLAGKSLPEAHTAASVDARVHKVESLTSTLLRAGVISSLVIVVAGTVITFLHHPLYLRSHRALRRLVAPGAKLPHTLAQVAAGIHHFRGQAVVALGLLLLIGTPVMRVAVSIFAFKYQKDRKFVAITSVVLLFLLLSFVLAAAGA